MSDLEQLLNQFLENIKPAPEKVEAYAVLAGGGVKGAALVGALWAARDLGVKFVGYGGASAGSLVALLAALKYPLKELKEIILNKEFTEFLDDGGTDLDRLKAFGLKRWVLRPWHLVGDKRLFDKLQTHLGLYGGDKLENFISKKIEDQFPDLSNLTQVTFHHLEEKGCWPLKIIVSDVSRRTALVYSAKGVNPDDKSELHNGDNNEGSGEIDDSVLHAVRASISYPFVFKPVKLKERYLVDGGLCSNLPVFLFAQERLHFGRPIIAFDLVSHHKPVSPPYKIRSFCRDLLATALEVSDSLHRKTLVDYLSNVFYVPIEVPAEIDTLDFGLTKDQRIKLFMQGYKDAQRHLSLALRNLLDARPGVKSEGVQGLLNLPLSLIKAPLKALVQEIRAETRAKKLRANVMLAVGAEKFVMAYQYGMDKDPDKEMEFNIKSGWVGQVFETRKPRIFPLNKLWENPHRFKLTANDVRKIRWDRQTVFSVPIFELREKALEAEKVDDLELLGVLSVDTDTPVEDTMWLEKGPFMLETATKWADVISKLLD